MGGGCGGGVGVHHDSHRLSVAPMLDCTDTHFRRLCRLLSKRVHLWTEMVNQDAVIHSHKTNPGLCGFGDEEHPITVQLGGSSPGRLARAAEICDAEYGYDEINLNCGCPSARVVAKKDADKCFGASLMRDPELVGECLRRMREAVDVPVTIKHRLGVRKSERSPDDSHDSYDFISRFVERVHELSGVKHFIVHARAAILGGLSPAANRLIPPLRYDEVHLLADDFPTLGFTLNGGVESLDDAEAHLSSGRLKGVMMGRAIYRSPTILAEADARIYGEEPRRWATAADAAGGIDGWAARDRDRDDVRLTLPAAYESTRLSTLCATRGEVLERYAVYGDSVLRAQLDKLAKHPKALGLPRALLKATHGVVFGAMGGAAFRKAVEIELATWSERLLAGEPAGALRFTDLMRACAGRVHGSDLYADVRARVGRGVVKEWAPEKSEDAASDVGEESGATDGCRCVEADV